jgi:hypothetical protein
MISVKPKSRYTFCSKVVKADAFGLDLVFGAENVTVILGKGRAPA